MSTKRSSWYSTPRTKRARPGIQLTLSPDAVAKLGALATAEGTSKSSIVEQMILCAEGATNRQRNG